MLCAGWGIASWAFSSQISHTVHLYANRTALVQPQYQQKPLWYSRQTFVSVLCCQHRDNEAAGTNPATPRLSCSPKTPLITTSCKASHLVKRLSPPITSTSIASLIALIWGQHGLLVYLLTYNNCPHFTQSSGIQRCLITLQWLFLSFSWEMRILTSIICVRWM